VNHDVVDVGDASLVCLRRNLSKLLRMSKCRIRENILSVLEETGYDGKPVFNNKTALNSPTHLVVLPLSPWIVPWPMRTLPEIR
jgi:hypothetical protein